MFWKHNYTASPHMEALLDKEDVTLTELMDQEDILQECKSQNKKLVDFLLRPEVMDELVTLITVEPPSDISELMRYKYPNTACEILTSDVPTLNERLSGDPVLGKLYGFLEQDGPLNPLLCSFFSKTIGMFITRRSEQVLEFLKSRDGFVKRLLHHIATPAIMDLLFKLITQVEGEEMKLNVLNWLDNEKIIQSLISHLSPDADSEIHSNVSNLLCDVIRASRENRFNAEKSEPDPILTALESPATMELLLDCILGEKRCESSIVGGIHVILALLDTTPPRPDSYGTENGPKNDYVDPEQQKKLIGALLPRLNGFHDILHNPPHKPAIKSTVGLLDPPFGNTRLQVSRLIVSLIKSGNTDVPHVLSSLGVVNTLLDLFFQYSWNNFLHCQVEQCINLIVGQQMVQDDDKINELHKNLFGECRLLQRILEAWKDNETQQLKERGIRQGYMGHLVKMANVVEAIPKESPLRELVKSTLADNSDMQKAWETFTNGPLAKTNIIQDAFLGGIHPAHCNSEEGSVDYLEVDFPATNINLQEQIPTVSSNYFKNRQGGTEFGDEDGFNFTSNDRLSSMTFNKNAGAGYETQLEAFKQSLAFESQKINIHDFFPANDPDDDILERSGEDPISSFVNALFPKGEKTGWPGGDTLSQDKPVDMDTTDPWENVSESAAAPVTSESPWSQDPMEATSEPEAPAPDNWADFSSNNFADFEANFTGTVSPVNIIEEKIATDAFSDSNSIQNCEIEESKTNVDDSAALQLANSNVTDSELKSQYTPETERDSNANPSVIATETVVDTKTVDVNEELTTDNHRFLTNLQNPTTKETEGDIKSIEKSEVPKESSKHIEKTVENVAIVVNGPADITEASKNELTVSKSADTMLKQQPKETTSTDIKLNGPV